MTTTSTGFIHVHCATCSDPNVWFTCNSCGKSDHFELNDGVVVCDCSAVYDRGTCTCGAEVPASGLSFVENDKGPLALADVEVAWGRVIALVLVLGGIIAGGLFWWLT
jgi:hypothetical protein